MTEQHSKWQTKEIAETFVEGVRGAIPGAKLQLEVISKIISVWCPHPSRILDLGCGDGILGRMLLEEYPEASVIFADFSDPMLDKLRIKIGINQRAKVIHADFAMPDWARGIESDKPLDIVVSGFAIHHQPDKRKVELYNEIFFLLGSGGVFLNLDQVKSNTPSTSEIFDDFFLDHVRRSLSISDQSEMMNQIKNAYYDDKKENIPSPVEKQCQWLRDIGFEDVDCFFKTFKLALFGGKKTSNKVAQADRRFAAPA